MSRFAKIKERLINTDHIVEVHDHKDGSITIRLDTGESIKAGSEAEVEIMGRDYVTAIIPCHGRLWAKMEQGGREFDICVEHLVLTADGSYYPLEASLLVEEFRGDVIYKHLLVDDDDDDEEYMRQNDDDDDEVLGIYVDSHRR